MNSAAALKSCCADLYASDWASLILGDSLHPGGAELTRRLGELMELAPGARVLDVAAGRGTSAIHLAQDFGCDLVGIDYSTANVAAARLEARTLGLDARVAFAVGDAERLPCADRWFDAATCECAFCTFPDKRTAAGELARVLRPGGVVGLADLVRRGRLPSGLDDLLAWIACIADARPPEEYVSHLTAAGLEVTAMEDHDEALSDLVRTVRLRLLGAQVVARLRGSELPTTDLARAGELARAAERAVADRSLGYVLMVARKPYLTMR
jgi:arsenite methyltransferase